jgi:putative membrane protein
MRFKKNIAVILTLFYAILWIGGIGTYVLLTQPPGEARWAAPTFLMLSALIVIIISEKRTAFLLFITGLTGFFFEVTGVHTGLPFGSYEYLDTVKPSVAGVPLPMISAWIVLPAFVIQLFSEWKVDGIKKILSSALCLTFIDLLIDPVAVGPMKFWRWENPGIYYGIPFINFIGWFVVSIIVFMILRNAPGKNSWHLNIGYSLILFFTIIAISKEMIIPTIIGIIISLLYIVKLSSFRKLNKQ